MIDIASPADLDRARADLELWRPALEAIRGAQGGLEGEPAAAPSGTLPVFVWSDRVVKLYAPASLWGGDAAAFADYEAELAALRLLSDRLPLHVPRVFGEGSCEGWRYLVMERIEGQPLETLLSEVPQDAAFATLRELGRSVAALHAIEPEAFPSTCAAFDAFLAGQEANVVGIQRAKGTPQAWLAPIDRFVAETPRGKPGRGMLHTEIAPSHVLATIASGRVVLEGLIDWVEAMPGDPEYDIGAVAFFLARGDGQRLGAFLDGYGWRGERGEALTRRLMRYLLLHRYAPFRWLIAQRPVAGARTVDDLLEPWLGVAS